MLETPILISLRRQPQTAASPATVTRTVHGSGYDDDSGKNKDVDSEVASGHHDRYFLDANDMEAGKMIQV